MLKLKYLIAFWCIVLPALGGAHAKETRTGKIEIKGHIQDVCRVHIKGGSTAAITTQYPRTLSETVALNSYCNREANHSITVTYDGQLKTSSSPTVIPFTVQADGADVRSGDKLASTGFETKKNIALKFAPATETPEGSYKGNVVFTVTSGS